MSSIGDDGFIHIYLPDEKNNETCDLSNYELYDAPSDVNFIEMRLKNSCKLAKIIKYIINNNFIDAKYCKVLGAIIDYIRDRRYLTEEYVMLDMKIRDACLKELIVNSGCSYEEQLESVPCSCRGKWHHECITDCQVFTIPFCFIYFS